MGLGFTFRAHAEYINGTSQIHLLHAPDNISTILNYKIGVKALKDTRKNGDALGTIRAHIERIDET